MAEQTHKNNENEIPGILELFANDDLEEIFTSDNVSQGGILPQIVGISREEETESQKKKENENFSFSVPITFPFTQESSSSSNEINFSAPPTPISPSSSSKFTFGENQLTSKHGPDDLYYWMGFANASRRALAEGRPTAPLPTELKKLVTGATEEILEGKGLLIPYAASRGTAEYLNQLVEVYKVEFKDLSISQNNIIFTDGITNGLHLVTDYISTKINKEQSENPGQDKKYYVIETWPYYLPFSTLLEENKTTIPNLTILNNMDGVKFQADDPLSKLSISRQSLTETLKTHELNRRDKKNDVKVFYFMNPTNPIGQSITKNEWEEIIKVLKHYPQALIIMDEAYRDVTADPFVSIMDIDGMKGSLKERIVILRSLSKGLSLAGERAGIIFSYNKDLIRHASNEKFKNAIGGNLPAQKIFADITVELHKNPDLRRRAYDEHYKGELKKLDSIIEKHEFKGKQVDIQQGGGFFRFADFKKMIGLPMNKNAAREVFGVDSRIPHTIETDLDIFHHILFQYKFAMFAPASKYGLPKKDCLFRLCVYKDEQMKLLDEIMGYINNEVELHKNPETAREKGIKLNCENEWLSDEEKREQSDEANKKKIEDANRKQQNLKQIYTKIYQSLDEENKKKLHEETRKHSRNAKRINTDIKNIEVALNKRNIATEKKEELNTELTQLREKLGALYEGWEKKLQELQKSAAEQQHKPNVEMNLKLVTQTSKEESEESVIGLFD